MRLILLTFILTSLFTGKSAYAQTETESLKHIIAIQNAQIVRLEASLKATRDRVTSLEAGHKSLTDKITTHSNEISTLTTSVTTQGNKWNGLDLTALQRVTSVAGGVRLNAAPFIYDFRENGVIWIWKDGQPVESLTINGSYETPQICRAYGRNCVKFH